VAERGGSRVHERWARLRFSIIGVLLAAPPAKGALRAALQQLAAREWCHPSTGAPVRFGVSTIERWLYRARNERNDPVDVDVDGEDTEREHEHRVVRIDARETVISAFVDVDDVSTAHRSNTSVDSKRPRRPEDDGAVRS